MRAACLFFFLWIAGSVHSQGNFTPQVAMIDDPGGFVVVRSEPSKESAKAGVVATGQFVYCLEPEGDWFAVTFLADRDPRPGYVPQSSMRFLSLYPRLEKVRESDTSCTFALDSIAVTFRVKPFTPAAHRLEYISPVERLHVARYLDKIDGKTFWGTDGKLPASMYDEISIRWDGRFILLPQDEIKDLFEPNLHPGFNRIMFDRNSQTLYICASNGDGAGGYVVLWVVSDGKYKQRFVVPGF